MVVHRLASQPSNFYSPRFLRLSSRLRQGPRHLSPLYPWANLCLFRLRIIMVTLVPWRARLNNLPARITTDFPPQRFIATITDAPSHWHARFRVRSENFRPSSSSSSLFSRLSICHDRSSRI